MAIETDTVTAPSSWLQFLVNGNLTGLSVQDFADARLWEKDLEDSGFYVVSDVENTNRFTWHGHIYGSSSSGVDVCEYVIAREI